jgi:hypothetical protein
MHRRQFLHAAATGSLAAAATAAPLTARQSTPATPVAGGSVSGLPARVAGVDPETLLSALREMPLTTPLLPADTPPVRPEPWDDESDSDLQGTLGGVLFTTGDDGNGNPILVGTAIVHPDAASAAGVITAFGEAPGDFLGLPWLVHVEPDFATSVVQVDYLLLVGGAEAFDDAATPAPGATPVASTGPRPLDLRAIGNMTALLDHLDSVLAGLEV